jgi:outer membrane protein TolC
MMRSSVLIGLIPGTRNLLLAVTTLSLFGCATVGPDFKRPAAPTVKGYTTQGLSAQTAVTPDTPMGGAQRFVVGQTVPASWWKNFGSAKLDQFIEQALRSSPSLEAAQATANLCRAGRL